MNWKPITQNPAKKDPANDFEISSPRIMIWIDINGIGCAEFGMYSFYEEQFVAVDNAWAKHISKGKAKITNWDYINEP